ncbi:MAG: ferritin-like domain-containing protein [Polyangiaceae bacterium]|nr:ferritin-like domain-containing protein [Polyangiaceae bacterium]
MHHPPFGTVERWAWDYVLGTSLASKMTPPLVPDLWENDPPVRRIAAPGRPPELVVVARARKVRGLRSPLGRARALHTFWHHELQAAELMAWALLAFADAPRDFRRGLLRLALDEIRHMNMYAAYIQRLGYRVGDFPVRDWFWARVPASVDPAAFVAVMGLGLESANVEHSAAFAARFRAAGDDDGARVQEIIGHEEIDHVRFGVEWFSRFKGSLTFAAWRASLPKPLSPMLMRGANLDRPSRMQAGQPSAFVDELEAWRWMPDSPGC